MSWQPTTESEQVFITLDGRISFNWNNNSAWRVRETPAPCQHCAELCHLTADNRRPTHKRCLEQAATAAWRRAGAPRDHEETMSAIHGAGIACIEELHREQPRVRDRRPPEPRAPVDEPSSPSPRQRARRPEPALEI